MSAPLCFLKQEIINRTGRDLEKIGVQIIRLVQGLRNLCSLLMRLIVPDSYDPID